MRPYARATNLRSPGPDVERTIAAVTTHRQSPAAAASANVSPDRSRLFCLSSCALELSAGKL
jgi:hypothetical protein